MKYWISAGILALTLNALLYGTQEVFSISDYNHHEFSQTTPGSGDDPMQTN